jgi:uncharacterized protein YbjT (DUF2867 family)
MKISIIGASHGTGAEAVRMALDRGHDVTAIARNPDRLALAHAKLTRMKGDFLSRESVDMAVRGQNAVIVTASATTLRAFKDTPTFFSDGTGHVVDAMKAHAVRRLVVLSAFGTGESRRLASVFVDKVVISWLLKAPFQDHERQEKLVKESGLEWVIARPGRLTNGPARRRYVRTSAIERVPWSISRADVADFLVTAAEGDSWVRQAVLLGG